jgi:hypothetical protein
MNRTVHTEIGVFGDDERAQRAVQELQANAVPVESIGVIRDPRKAREIVGTRVREFIVPMTILGAVGALLLLLLVPGAEEYKTNPSAIVPWLFVGALAGLVTGALLGQVTPRKDATLYERRLEQGAVLVTVHVIPAEERRVRRILAGAGAENLTHEAAAEAL